MSEEKKSIPVTDLSLLIKYKQAGLADHLIAKKLGIPEEEVLRRWNDLLKASQEQSSSGYADLTVQVNVFAHQYQLLGQSLTILAKGLTDRMTPEELRILIVSDPEQTLKNLLSRCIVLRPFVAIDPVKALEEHTRQVQEGN